MMWFLLCKRRNIYCHKAQESVNIILSCQRYHSTFQEVTFSMIATPTVGIIDDQLTKRDQWMRNHVADILLLINTLLFNQTAATSSTIVFLFADSHASYNLSSCYNDVISQNKSKNSYCWLFLLYSYALLFTKSLYPIPLTRYLFT